MNLDVLVNSYFDRFIDDAKDLISIKSVLDKADINAPFGVGIANSLNKMIEISNKLGFKTYVDPEGYYGYAELGEGKSLFGVLGHLDVVPANDIENWSSNPFELTIKDNQIIARGIQDDKGPTLLSMYALKALLDNGYELNKRIRFIFGTDEENLWRGITKYQEKEEMPDMGFTPDSKFPLIYAEKGLLQVKLTSKQHIDFEFKGGDAFNAVPAKAEIKLDNELVKILDELKYEYRIDKDNLIVEGKSVHAQASDTGINACVRLMKALSKKQVNANLLDFVMKYGQNPNGEDLFGKIEDEHSGKLMFNIGMVNFTADTQEIDIDMRIPVTYDKELIVKRLKEVAKEFDLHYEEFDYLKSIYVSKESELVKSLMQAYVDVTNDTQSQPMTSGGATYARAMDNCVAFGAVLPSGLKTEHQANERVNIDEFKIAMKIYMQAFRLLVLKERKNEKI
ncbi:Sapep family Mn(2+)-dependent dipeptidase [Mycoplasma sp. P36-A1]|uniref:Sapep family Mn(2+)-dependent dipeptidase n=1 Tax=Mycoplasma sp. P36-A1 TaxID=3252900 RepID=UPI003C2B1F75